MKVKAKRPKKISIQVRIRRSEASRRSSSSMHVRVLADPRVRLQVNWALTDPAVSVRRDARSCTPHALVFPAGLARALAASCVHHAASPVAPDEGAVEGFALQGGVQGGTNRARRGPRGRWRHAWRGPRRWDRPRKTRQAPTASSMPVMAASSSMVISLKDCASSLVLGSAS